MNKPMETPASYAQQTVSPLDNCLSPNSSHLPESVPFERGVCSHLCGNQIPVVFMQLSSLRFQPLEIKLSSFRFQLVRSAGLTILGLHKREIVCLEPSLTSLSKTV